MTITWVFSFSFSFFLSFSFKWNKIIHSFIYSSSFFFPVSQPYLSVLFEDYDADLVVTVCDSAAGESCPVYFGKSLKVHWGLEDPSKLEGSEQAKAEAFNNTIDIIEKRVAALAELAEKNLDKAALKEALSKLGAQ